MNKIKKTIVNVNKKCYPLLIVFDVFIKPILNH